MIEYTLYGEPQAWVRPRSNGRRHFTPQHVTDEELRHREAALLCRPEGWDATDREAEFAVYVTLYVGVVKKGERKGLRKRIDTDNALKLIFDGLTGAAFADDEQVADHRLQRRIDRDDPRTEVRVVRVEAAK